MSPARKRRVESERRKGDQREARPRRRADRRSRRVEQVLIFVAVLCFAVGWFSLQRQSDRITDVVAQIQTERERNTLRACQDLNARHDKTVERVHELTHGEDTEDVRKFLSLIDVQLPHKDCAAQVRQQVQGSKP